MTEFFPITKWPEGEHPREKLIQFGASALSDAELLAILLRVGNEGATAIDMGRLLIDKLGGFQGIDRAHPEEIMKIKGLGIAKTAQLKWYGNRFSHMLTANITNSKKKSPKTKNSAKKSVRFSCAINLMKFRKRWING